VVSVRVTAREASEIPFADHSEIGSALAKRLAGYVDPGASVRAASKNAERCRYFHQRFMIKADDQRFADVIAHFT
jgi:hypothetical protein